MNFPLFYWNIARIPIATTFLFWWCATLVKFGWEITPQRFLFEWKSTSEKFGREVAPPGFHFQSKSASHAEVAPPHFYFRTDFPFSRYRRGGRSRHIGPEKESHVLSTYKRQEHASKTRAKREQNARNMLVYPAPDYTAPAPSFSKEDEGITRAVVTKKWRSWRVCIQNEDVHIARNSYFRFNTPKLVIFYQNESLVVPSFPLSSASSENFPLR